MKDILRAIAVIVAMLIGLALSWASVAIVTYVVCLCFGWEYAHLKAAGVWLIYIFVKDAITVRNYRKNNM